MHRELGRDDTTRDAFCDIYHADLHTWLPLWYVIVHGQPFYIITRQPAYANKKDTNMIYKTLYVKLQNEQHELHYNPGVNTCAL